MDELEQSVTASPEEAESFSQSVVDTDPEPTPEPAPEPEAEAQDAPYVGPDWLNEPAPVPDAPPAQYPPNMPYYNYQQQQPQARQGPVGDAALNAFVEDPDGWLNSRLEQQTQQMMGPIAQQQMAMNHMMGQIIEGNVSQGVANVDATIKGAYNTFNQDPTFRSNKAIQEQIGSTLRGLRRQAIYEARNGDFSRLNSLSRLGKAEIAGALAYARAAAGQSVSGAEGPLQIEGAQVESSRRPVAGQGDVTFDAETEAAIKRLGPAYRERLVKATRETEKYDDFEG